MRVRLAILWSLTRRIRKIIVRLFHPKRKSSLMSLTMLLFRPVPRKVGDGWLGRKKCSSCLNSFIDEVHKMQQC